MQKRTCAKCNQEFELSENNFYKRSNRPKKPFDSYCKKCRLIIGKKYYQKSIDAGKCPYCSKKSLEHTVHCFVCYFKNLSYKTFGNSKSWVKIAEVVYKQNYICPYTGDKLIPGLNMSLDHIIPHKGNKRLKADINNLQFVRYEINMAKHKMSHDEFIKMCKKVYDYMVKV